MATLMTDADRNALADAGAAPITYLSLHTATPGTTGASEATGGDPAYARKTVTFNAAGAEGPLGATLQPATVGIACSTQVTFDVPAATYTHWGARTLVAGDYCIGNVLLPSSQTVGTQAQILHSVGVGAVSGA